MKNVPVIIGMECIKLGGVDDDAPWRMTVDAFEDGSIKRYQLVGKGYNAWPSGAPERTLEEMARVFGHHSKERTGEEIARELDAADREFIEAVQGHADKLYRRQVEILYGEEGLKLIDRQEET